MGDGFNLFDATFVDLLALFFWMRKLVSLIFQNKCVFETNTASYNMFSIESSRDPHPVISSQRRHREDDYTCQGSSTTPNRRAPFVPRGPPKVRANESLFLAARLRYPKYRHHEE